MNVIKKYNTFVEKIELEVPDLHHRIRIDQYLTYRIGKISRNQIVKGIKSGKILLNYSLTKPGKLLNHGDIISIVLERPDIPQLMPEKMDLDIVYENSEFLIINKPSGMVMHPTRQHFSGTLVSGVLYHLNLKQHVKGNTGIIHRLDQFTSGIVIFAKNKSIQRMMMRLFQERTIEKTYLAIVRGIPEAEQGVIKTNIGRGQIVREKREVYPFQGLIGQTAISEFHVIDKFGSHSLLKICPLTGRTHQIRVHLNHLGHPIEGEQVYTSNMRSIMKRQALHAFSLKFVHPVTNEFCYFEAPMPLDMREFITNNSQ